MYTSMHIPTYLVVWLIFVRGHDHRHSVRVKPRTTRSTHHLR